MGSVLPQRFKLDELLHLNGLVPKEIRGSYLDIVIPENILKGLGTELSSSPPRTPKNELLVPEELDQEKNTAPKNSVPCEYPVHDHGVSRLLLIKDPEHCTCRSVFV